MKFKRNKKRMTDVQKRNREDKVRDKSLPLKDRQKAHEELMDEVLNPKDEFDSETFDPMDDVEGADVKCRKRCEPPRRLPTMGMRPKKILEGQMIGMLESKQDLYLLIAWLSERVSDLEDELHRKGEEKNK